VAYDYSIDDPARNRKWLLAFVLVVIIHVLFFWVLASGLGAKVVEVVMGPVQTKIIDEKPDEDKPPPPPPEIDTPPPYVPPPEVSIEIATDSAPTTAITNVTSERPVAPVAAPPPPPKPVERQVVRTPPSTQGRGARITKPDYPPASRRAGEEGTVTLSALVLESGKIGDIKIVKSSGFEKLDEAAVKDVQRNWRFVPGKEDGKPVSMWHTFQVTFRLQD
jgi:protein TonB